LTRAGRVQPHRWVIVVALLAAFGTAPASAATDAPGGTSPAGSGSGAETPAGSSRDGGGAATTPAPKIPKVSRLVCLSRCGAANAAQAEVAVAPRGIVRLAGRNLGAVTRVRFLGGAGTADDAGSPVRAAEPNSLRVRVPSKAVTGPVQVVDRFGQASPASRTSLRISGPAPAPAESDPQPAPAPPAGPLDPALSSGHTFPVLGPHDFGGAGAGFGATRDGHTHQGQDVMAACGTQLVAARGGTVQKIAVQSAAGNYVVIDGDGVDYDYAYMHLQDPAPLTVGQHVETGGPIGLVGQTGNAQGCHLHFELWTGPGYYEGGSPIDPSPALRAWDAAG